MATRRRVVRICAAGWLPLLLAVTAVVLHSVVDEFLLGVLLLLLALGATGLRDAVGAIRSRRRSRPRGNGPS